MKISIDVKDREEARNLRAGLTDPTVRALAVMMGALSRLPTNRARARVLRYVADRLEEDREKPMLALRRQLGERA